MPPKRPSKPFRKPAGAGSDRPFRKRDGDRKPRRDDERGERKPFDRKPRRDDERGEKKPYERKERSFARDGEKKPFTRRDDERGERKPFDRKPRRDDERGEKKPYERKERSFARDGEKKPFTRRDDERGERKPFDRKPRRDDERGEKKPYERKERSFTRDGEKKPFTRRDDERGDRKPFDRKPRRDDERGEKKPYERKERSFTRDGEKKPFTRRDDERGERKPFDRKPRRDGERGEKKPYERKERSFTRDGEKKPFTRRDDERSERKPFDRKERDERPANGERKRIPKPPTYLDTYQKPKHSFFRANEEDAAAEKPSKPATSKSGKAVAVARKEAGAVTAKPARSRSKESAPTAKAPDAIRIAKRISDAGICSRRDAERMIEEGRITVNDVVIDTPATLVTPKDYVRVDGDLIGRAAGAPRLFLYHKPRGELTTTRDPEGRPTIFDHLPKNLPRLIAVGRLDLDSEGLILLTNSGMLSRQLELPSSGIPRTYRVRTLGTLQPESIEQLARGITVEGVEYGPITARPEERTTDGRNVWVEVTLHEGKNREIRRVFESLGHSVSRLMRESYGPFTLGRLPRGALMEIKPKEWYKALNPFIDLSNLTPDKD